MQQWTNWPENFWQNIFSSGYAIHWNQNVPQENFHFWPISNGIQAGFQDNGACQFACLSSQQAFWLVLGDPELADSFALWLTECWELGRKDPPACAFLTIPIPQTCKIWSWQAAPELRHQATRRLNTPWLYCRFWNIKIFNWKKTSVFLDAALVSLYSWSEPNTARECISIFTSCYIKLHRH